jgi:hypothetical protein
MEGNRWRPSGCIVTTPLVTRPKMECTQQFPVQCSLRLYVQHRAATGDVRGRHRPNSVRLGRLSKSTSC